MEKKEKIKEKAKIKDMDTMKTLSFACLTLYRVVKKIESPNNG